MKNMIIISSKKNPFYRQRYNSLIWLEQRVISDPGGMYNNFLYTHQIAGFMLNYWVQATSHHSILHRKICKMLKNFFFFFFANLFHLLTRVITTFPNNYQHMELSCPSIVKGTRKFDTEIHV